MHDGCAFADLHAEQLETVDYALTADTRTMKFLCIALPSFCLSMTL